jgi:hypothetical protein
VLGGIVGAALEVLAVALLAEERRIGRTIGLWDLWPQLRPGTAPVKSSQSVWWWHASLSPDGVEPAVPHRTAADDQRHGAPDL